MEEVIEDVNEIIDQEVDEDLSQQESSELNEQVISFVENDVILFRVEYIVLKSLVTKKVRRELQTNSKRLETKVKYEVKESNYLVSIWGKNRDNVIECRMTLNRLLALTRRKRPFTHLITVPFTYEPLKREFIRFMDNVLNTCKDSHGIDDTLFQQPFKLHLTFCVLVLINRNEVLMAKELLRQSLDQIVKPILQDKPLKVSIEGLDVIKGNPKRCHVLYAQIKDESNRLQTIADQIVGHYVKSGLLDESNENKVKLHITFLNSLFRQRLLHKDLKTSPKKRIKREVFDAQEIIETYKTHKFGEFIVEKIQLNDIKTKTEEGFYGLVEEIVLPKE